MSATTCPNCGKPLRPGAKFCGNCGATLPGGTAFRTTAAAQPGDIPCPHCGKPVRSEAKFCGYCGNSIQNAVTATAGAPAASGDRPALPTQPEASAVSVERRTPPASATGRSPRRGLAFGLIAMLFVVCILVGVAGFFAARQMEWFKGIAGAPTVTVEQTNVAGIAATSTLAPVTAPGITRTPTATLIPTQSPTASVSPTIIQSPTPDSTITVAQPPAAGVSPTGVMTPALAAPLATALLPTATTAVVAAEASPAQTIFEDTFDRPLNENWVAWGPTFPTIKQGFQDRWLSLLAEDLSSGGVTTGQAYRIFNAPGTVIEFEAQLDPGFRGFSIVMDWDQEEIRRNTDYLRPGMIRVEIRSEAAVLSTLLSEQNCLAAVDGTTAHVYRIEILEGQAVALVVDGGQTGACTIANMGIAPLPGKLSLSGLGWVTRVKVGQRPAQ